MIFLTLGPVTFANFEIPERINFGGEQALSVKQLVGGQRIVDAMGRVDDEISWSGLMFESTATFRGQFLDSMRVQGTPLPLTWGNFNYLVVIKSFRATFERTYQIPYNITVVVIQDLNKPLPFLVPVLYNDAIISEMTEASDIASAIKNPSITNALALLSAAINLVPNFDLATSTQIASVLAPLGSAISIVTSSIASLNLSVFPKTSSLSTTTTTPIEADVMSQDLLSFGNMYQLLAILNNMDLNLSLISEGAAGQTITVSNTNLFQLAAKYYGDPLQWVTIANANGLSDPYVTGGVLINCNIISGGSNYTNPTITFFGNVLITPIVKINIVSGVITSITIYNGGLFTNNPQIIITDSTGSGANIQSICGQALVIPSSATANTGGVLVE